MKKLQKMRKNQKGFTLVELIVVLVILAILAAMLVPALLGYIDRAKEGKYEEEVHSIYTALQVCFDEGYAKGMTPSFTFSGTVSKDAEKLNNMIEPTEVTAITKIYSDKAGTVEITQNKASTDKTDFTVQGFEVTFKSQDGTENLTGKLVNGVVEVTIPASTGGTTGGTTGG